MCIYTYDKLISVVPTSLSILLLKIEDSQTRFRLIFHDVSHIYLELRINVELS